MTQNDVVLRHLRRKPITPLEAIAKYGILRLGARIYELKKDGHEIASELVSVHNRDGAICNVARYSLR